MNVSARQRHDIPLLRPLRLGVPHPDLHLAAATLLCNVIVKRLFVCTSGTRCAQNNIESVSALQLLPVLGLEIEELDNHVINYRGRHSGSC
jgi:hypothetical protein